jgi:hypothetical protein
MAVGPYLKLLARVDRYQPAAGAPKAYDAEARERLLAKMTRLAARFESQGQGRSAARTEADETPAKIAATPKPIVVTSF